MATKEKLLYTPRSQLKSEGIDFCTRGSSSPERHGKCVRVVRVKNSLAVGHQNTTIHPAQYTDEKKPKNWGDCLRTNVVNEKKTTLKTLFHDDKSCLLKMISVR